MQLKISVLNYIGEVRSVNRSKNMKTTFWEPNPEKMLIWKSAFNWELVNAIGYQLYGNYDEHFLYKNISLNPN